MSKTTTAYIYKITNKINGKAYIGFTSRSVEERLQEHRRAFGNKILYKAIRKYGWDNFTKEVIFESWDPKWCLNEIETFFIKIFDTYHNGYNMTFGGEGTLGYEKVVSEKTKSIL